MGGADEHVNTNSDDSLRSTHVIAYDYVRFNEALLTNKVMLFAYASSIIIVAIGVVALVLMLAALCFFYPEKANNAGLIFLGGPLMGILIANISKIKSVAKKVANAGDNTQSD